MADRPRKLSQMLDAAGAGATGVTIKCSSKMHIHIEGTFSGATVEIQGRLTPDLSFITLHYEDGTDVIALEPIADLMPDGLARFSELRAVVVGGDGSTSLTAWAAEASL